MPQPTGEVHTYETSSDGVWPVRTRAVSRFGSAFALEGTEHFDLDDLILARWQFPERRVTLDGDVITIWPGPGCLGGERTPSPLPGCAVPSHPPPRKQAVRSAVVISPPHNGDSQDPRDPKDDPARVLAGRANSHNYKSTSGSESDRMRPEMHE